MTLRLRLVAAIVLLATSGLVLFGVITYSLYRHSEYQGLDNQLRTSAPVISSILYRPSPGGPGGPDGYGSGGPGPGNGNGNGNGNGHNGQPGDHGGPPSILVPFGALYNSAGQRLGELPVYSTSAGSPKVPSSAFTTSDVNHIFSTGSVKGSTQWLVLVTAVNSPGAAEYLAVAVPTTDVTSALGDLVLIETSAAVGLLVLLSIGCWLVLRRGLRPLEQMATTARAISTGDLSHRVTEVGDSSEVGQLGVAFNAMLEDIESAFAERDATEDRLRQFLADASHELRTPLTSIQGFAELARLERVGEGDNRQPGIDPVTALSRIEDQAGRMRLLVEDLLLLARLDQTRPAETAPVDLTVLAADACTDAVAIAPEREIRFDGPDAVVVLGDQSHLRQAISNLVGNAIRHTPDGSLIEVRSLRRGSEAVVQIRDHGSGLDSEALTHVFDRFWRADRSRSTQGLGLGLSIVQAIASEHGGRAEAANEPSGGAVFSIFLPAA